MPLTSPSEEERPKPAKKLTQICVDHRIPARQIEAMILDVFDVPMTRRYEVVRLAIKISKTNGDYFLKLAHLFNNEAEGNA